MREPLAESHIPAAQALMDLRSSIEQLTRPPRVLIVDDRQEDRILLRLEIQKIINAQIFEAIDSKDAVEMAKHTNFDTIFLDMVMPGTSGLEFLNQITCKNIVVLVTGFDAHSPDVLNALKLGAVTVLTKPVSAEALRAVFGNPRYVTGSRTPIIT